MISINSVYNFTVHWGKYCFFNCFWLLTLNCILSQLTYFGSCTLDTTEVIITSLSDPELISNSDSNLYKEVTRLLLSYPKYTAVRFYHTTIRMYNYYKRTSVSLCVLLLYNMMSYIIKMGLATPHYFTLPFQQNPLPCICIA